MPLKSILIKLDAIDIECEEVARREIDMLYAGVRYDGARLATPEFKKVGDVWVELIKNKELRIKNQLNEIIVDSGIYFSPKIASKVFAKIKYMFAEEKYLSRLTLFSEGVARKASSYGIKFDQNALRLDISNTGYQVSVKNTLRGALSRIESELELYRYKSAPGSILEINKWRSYLTIKPAYTLSVLVLLLLIGLVSSIGVSDIIELVFGSGQP